MRARTHSADTAGAKGPREAGVPDANACRAPPKTGTTCGYTDNLALGTTAEYTVGAWAGNFDGTPTEGMMAMYGAAPLVRAAFVALAARFGEPRAPARPDGLHEAEVCPLSGQRPGPYCPSRKRELFVEGSEPGQTCAWHVWRCGQVEVDYPESVRPWARATGLLQRTSACAAPATGQSFRIVYPGDGARFVLDPYRPAEHQRPPLRTIPAGAAASFTIDGVPARNWVPTAGEHLVRAQQGNDSDEVRITFD